MSRRNRNALAFAGGFVLICTVALLTACGPTNPMSVKDVLSEQAKAQVEMSPELKRYVLLADVKSWTRTAKAYSARDFCPQPTGTPCAEKSVVRALDDTLQRLAPTVEVLRVTASADELTTYLVLTATLLTQLQAELAKVLVEETG